MLRAFLSHLKHLAFAPPMRADKWADRGGSALPISPMATIGRKHLPHDGGPLNLENPEGEVYFITICCVPRGSNQLANAGIWQAIDKAIALKESSGELTCRLALAMPDHFHALLGFPGTKPMVQVVTALKSWMASRHGIRWQRDFFDHRVRGWESAQEKAKYIRMNPVRAGLVANPEDWPYQR